MDLPKYARLENERRFRVDAARCPPLAGVPVVRIEDRYLPDTRLRLRRVMGEGVAPIYKLCRKYLSEDPYSGPIANLYLSAAEYAQLAVLPAAIIDKRRYRVDGFGIDVFEGRHAGLILAEIEAETRAALLAVVPPVWAAAEVTDDLRYTGAALARDGLPPQP